MRVLSLALLAMPCAAIAATPVGHANLKNASGDTVATATFTRTHAGVRVVLVAKKLPPGTHGFHVHAVGMCEGPDFKSAGPHFNPTEKKHGTMNPEGHHAGDLPNLVVRADGHGKVAAVIPASLGDGPDSLFHEGGTSLVVHADPDDMKTDPAGNSGPRIACGVIEH